MDKLLMHAAFKPLVFTASLLPFVWLIVGAYANTLGSNPAETLIRSTGDWALRFLCLTLAITPMRHWTGLAALARLRRMLGLYAFFYGVVHFLCYAWLEMGFFVDDIAGDIAQRPFILVGVAALLLMAPLAATSFNRVIKAMGAARWQALHRSVYAIVGLALLHFAWIRAGKNDFAEWSVWASAVTVLLGWRAIDRLGRMRATERSRPDTKSPPPQAEPPSFATSRIDAVGRPIAVLPPTSG